MSDQINIISSPPIPVGIEDNGTPPPGVPSGGTDGQMLYKDGPNPFQMRWGDAPAGGDGGGISDAPNNGNYYLRHGLAWSIAAVVAQSGAYADLTGKPTLGTAAAQNTGFFALAAHTHDAADVVSGTFANARIAVGNVTQHAASLSINYSQLTGTAPPLLVTKINLVASQAAMVALTAEEGDIAIRSDVNKTFAHNSGTSGTVTDWSEMLTPTAAVSSFNGRTGAIVPTTGDYTFAQIGSLPTTAAGYGIPAATGAVDGYATATQITKLNGIAAGATANSADATLLARANHTGSQLASTISDFSTAADARVALKKESIIVACSDETTALTAGTGKVTFRMPYAFTLTAVRALLVTAQTSGSIFTVDINEAGVSVISTKLTIDNTEKTSVTAATAAVISDASLADDAEITVDIDQIGDGTAKGLKICLIGHQ